MILSKRFFMILLLLTIGSAAIAKEPVPLDGIYNMSLDRSKQTFNGHLVSTDRPVKQTEQFTTHCDKTGCMAHSINKRPPPTSFDYRWVNDHWESVPGQQQQYLLCKDGSKVNSIKMDIITPKAHGRFSGERIITVKGPGCPGEGPGNYALPFTLEPVHSNKVYSTSPDHKP